MILVFGGTTEGRKTVEVLEESGNRYYYSTKTGEQELTLHHGIRLDGALNEEAMCAICEQQHIQLLVDAAHPFARELHTTVLEVASRLHLPVIRFERIYPPRDTDIEWIDDYTQVPKDIHTLLATTGVQSIRQLKYLEEQGVRVIYRILDRQSSRQLAYDQGATDEQLCFYEEGGTITVDADAILMKESGGSGGFVEKVTEARTRGMRVIALKRPVFPFTHCVDGPHGLRRMIEQLLPDFFPLHSGLTTGTCATAAAIAATIRLLKNETPKEVSVLLPDGESIMVSVGYGKDDAYCIKEAGDDPDVTDGIEIHAQVEPSDHFEILGGSGVGHFTLPGFDFPPGEPAINKGPRQMLMTNLSPLTSHLLPLKITLSVPDGAEIAKRTFNPRLGIEGGISIIGVSGIVKPFSEEAFLDAIRKCLTVAKASGAERVVINSGGKSERFVHARYPQLPSQAFVEYGNYIGATLQMAHELDIPRVTLGVMLGKAVKLAAGHLDTHSRKTTMDLAFVQSLLDEAGISLDIRHITLARELWEVIPPSRLQTFATTVIRHCAQHCRPLLPQGELTILLIDDQGHLYSE